MKGEAKAKLRFLRLAPRKVRLVAGLIRGMKLEEAKTQLYLSKKEAARPVLKLLLSVVANAKQNHDLKEETLRVKSITVDGGPILHRWMPRAMGSAGAIAKRTSHISVVLEGEVDEKISKKKEKTVVKEK